MRARLVVFPVKGRNWCFSRSVDTSSSAAADSASAHTPSGLRELCTKISNNSDPKQSNAELLIDFVSNKMNRAWMGLEKAPEGTFKNKIHGLGLRLLARVKPSEMFLKSITKEVSSVEITYPPSLNARLVRRRLRHVAKRGTIIHRKYFYGSVSLLPLTTAFTVLPLPNIPFFWILFRTYSHWRALQGSEKLLELVSDSSAANVNEGEHEHDKLKDAIPDRFVSSTWPSEQLEGLIQHDDGDDGLSKSTISTICKTFNLNAIDALKYRNSM
ncbi:uncharacterized protein C23H3.12c isoform X2 [Punica granatum]|uniref:Uncharacterized protein C23H3.12c isoform X2 n=1 Tax=Punica granatum TaxID=22663 RepID=A0A6P8CWP7_PUNGR|nr:uncharacterized protein C23H3.12c isoform X2 [Punica granatum]